MSQLFVGTEAGLKVVTDRGGAWEIEDTILEGKEISATVKLPDGGMVIATRDDGLFKFHPATGALEQINDENFPPVARCIAVDPTDSNRMFAGFEPSAIWRTLDGGKSWTECKRVAEMSDELKWEYHIPQIPSHVRTILIDWKDPQRIYAGVQIGGVLLSEDGGDTWTNVIETLDPDVHHIAQDPQDPQIMYAATGAGGPMHGPQPPVAPNGFPIYRSEDRGLTWHSISSDFSRRHGMFVHVDNDKSGTLVSAAATPIPPTWRTNPRGADAVVVVSNDRGDTWQEVKNGLPASFPLMVEVIEKEAKEKGRIYLALGGEGTRALPKDRHYGEIYYAEDAQGPWEKVDCDLPLIFTLTAA